MAQWNLTQLANTLVPLFNETEPLQEALDEYRKTFQKEWLETMAAKIGINYKDSADDQLITELLEILSQVETDMTIFYRNLADISQEKPEGSDELAPFEPAFYKQEELTDSYRSTFTTWLDKYRNRLNQDPLSDEQRKQKMNRVNPKFVFRNYLAQLAIDKAEQGDFSLIDELMEVLKNPYDEQPGKETFATRRPEWARNKPGCSMLSCSS